MAEQQFTTEELANETWKPLDFTQGVYGVSSFGRVRRYANSILRKPGRPWNLNRNSLPIMMQQQRTTRDYMSVRLMVDGKSRTFMVHRIAAHAFIGPCPGPKIEVNHKDGVKTNNRVENLEYCTHQENIRHAARLGLIPTGERRRLLNIKHCLRGERHQDAKLTEDDVRRLRADYTGAYGEMTQLARRYNMSANAMKKMIQGRSWSHVK